MNIHEDRFHKETGVFVKRAMERGWIIFTEESARILAQENNLKQMHIVYRDLQERKIIYRHPLGWAFDPISLYRYFSAEMLN